MPFAPTDISGLVAWYKADAITGLSDGDPVAAWTDSSGSSNDQAQSTALNKPVYKTSIQNGMPVVRFDGTNSWMRSATGAATGNAAHTILFVAKYRGSGSTFQGFGYYGGGAGTGANSAVGITPGSWWYGGYGDTTPTGAATETTKFHIVGKRYSSGSVQGRLDVANDGSVGSYSFSLTGGDIGLGGHYYTGSAVSSLLSCDIAEVLMYNSSLSDADIHNVEVYLNARWALNIAYPGAFLTYSALLADSTGLAIPPSFADIQEPVDGHIGDGTCFATNRKVSAAPALILEGGVATDRLYGRQGKDSSDGNPTPSLVMIGGGRFLFGWSIPRPGTFSVSVDCEYTPNDIDAVNSRPQMTVYMDPSVGLLSDVVAYPAMGAGWHTVTATVTVTTPAFLKVELLSQYIGIAHTEAGLICGNPLQICHWDNLVTPGVRIGFTMWHNGVPFGAAISGLTGTRPFGWSL